MAAKALYTEMEPRPDRLPLMADETAGSVISKPQAACPNCWTAWFNTKPRTTHGYIDGCEIGSKARNAVRLCDINLHRLMNELEEWEIRSRRTSKEVAHG